MTWENKLADEILATIEGMLARPEMYAGCAEAIEAQFFTLFTLVAPYRFGMTGEEAAERIREFVHFYTKSNHGLSSVKTDVKEIAVCFSGFYQTYKDNVMPQAKFSADYSSN